MSWIFGILKKNKKNNINFHKIKSIHPEPLSQIQNKNIYITIGGYEKTCYYNKDSKKEKRRGWMCCGAGIKNNNGKFFFVNSSDWEHYLCNYEFNLNKLNGHFITLIWQNDYILIRNDQLGMRDMFFTENEEYYAFSTRLDWIIKLQNEIEIDFKIFGSSWNLVHPLGFESFVKNIKRLGQGGIAQITPKKFTLSNHPWKAEYANTLSEFELIQLVRNLTLFPLNENMLLTHALSGGIDSRTILAFLMSGEHNNWNVITWGNKLHPDVKASQKIIKHFSLDHKFLYKPIDSQEKCISLYKKFVSESNAVVPAYLFSELSYYKDIDDQGIFIDGGCGALFRRAIANKLLYFGRKALRSENIQGIIKQLIHKKADIFTEEVKKDMNNGMKIQLENAIEKMPDINDFGLENWVDLFNIRYKMANLGSVLQSRLDGYLKNYMPFGQPSVLRKVLKTPADKRKNSKLNKQVLKNYRKELLKFPIVKYETIIPFQTNTFRAFLIAKIKKKLSGSSPYNILDVFLHTMREYVQDKVRSQEVKNFEYYDYKKIRNIVDGFYEGNKIYAMQLNWWLTFDVWRELIYNKHFKHKD